MPIIKIVAFLFLFLYVLPFLTALCGMFPTFRHICFAGMRMAHNLAAVVSRECCFSGCRVVCCNKIFVVGSPHMIERHAAYLCETEPFNFASGNNLFIVQREFV